MHYEIWEKSTLATRKGLPVSVHYTPDVSYQEAVKLSRGTTVAKIFNPNKKVPGQIFGGTYEDVEVPKAFAVVEKGDRESRVRGWGINGKWVDARDCKRCSNSGQDPNSYQLPCGSCQGASYKPKL